jgi:AsmA-like C-terminal region/AsmA family
MRSATIALAAILALAAIALTALNLYVQSLATQARIQQELSQRLGTPLQIKAVGVTPWGGLTLSGITIPSVAPNSSSDFFEAKSFHLHVGVFSLFSGKLLIKRVSLLNPTVVWSQNEEGKWQLPGSQKKEHRKSTPEEPAGVASAGETPTSPLSASPTSAPVAPLPAASLSPGAASHIDKAKGDLVPDVRRLNVSEGNFRFLDRSGKMVAAFEGVNFHATVHNLIGLRGGAAIAKMSVRDRFFLERLHSSFRYDPAHLELSKMSAQAASGDVIGALTLNPEADDSPFKVSFNFRNLEADQIVSDAGGPHGMIQGKLEGKFEATGKASDPNALTGAGEIVLREGQLQQYSLLVALGQVLQIEELTQLHLDQAQARYHVTPGLVVIDDLVLRSPNIRLSATGTVTFDGKLRLDSQLAINEKVRSQLFKPIRENFRPIAESGYSAIDFQIGGTIDRPKSNLVDRVVGRDLKDIVSGLFGGGKKSDKSKKKKQKEAEVSPAEETSPAPAPSAENTAPGAVAASPSPSP